MSEPSLPPPDADRSDKTPSHPHGEAKAARRLLILALALIVIGGGGLLMWDRLWQANGGPEAYVRPLPSESRPAPEAPAAPQPAPSSQPPQAPIPASPAERKTAPTESAPTESAPPTASAPPPAASSADDLAARLAALEARLAAANPPLPPSQPAPPTADSQTLAQLQAQVATLENDLNVERDRATRAEAAARAANDRVQKAIKAAAALAHLRTNVERGQPFEREYDEAHNALTFDPRSDALLQPLRQWAESGIATPGELRETLESLGSDIVRAALLEEAHTPWQTLVARLKALVIVRPTPDGDIPQAGTEEGDRPPAIVARAEARLRDDDVAGALSELAPLSGAAADTAQAWVAAARARVAADATMAALDDELQTLSSASASSAAPKAVKPDDNSPSGDQ